MSEEMEVRLVIVDKIPSDCNSCEFCYWLGHKSKGAKIEDHYQCAFIDDELENEIDTSRNKKCPLETFDGLPYFNTTDFRWVDGKLVRVHD